MFPDYSRIKLQPLKTTWLSAAKAEAAMLRLDLLHPDISGNKWFKLKYNIEAALQQNKKTLLTFGGARSNHIAATAAAASLFGLKSIGIIRGEATQKENPTLKRAQAQGMTLQFIGYSDYRRRSDSSFLKQIQEKFPHTFMIPEGGNNDLGIKGAKEILKCCDTSTFTHLCCPVGTGSTLAGIISQSNSEQSTLGFCALKKDEEQRTVIQNYLDQHNIKREWNIFSQYSMGGFAKKPKVLIEFMHSFEMQHHIPLDVIYNAKMLFGIKHLVEQKYFPAGSRILIIHTGGLQGNHP